MSQNDKGNTDDKILATFDTLDLEGADKKKAEDLMKFLKESLSAEKYKELETKLGLKKDLTNTELLAAIEELMKKKKIPDEEDEENLASYKEFIASCVKGGKTIEDCAKEWKSKYPEKKLASYKEFMAKCMKGGKKMGECADEYKKKYPGPEASKEEQDEIAQLAETIEKELKKKKDEEDEYPEPVKKKMEQLELTIQNLTTQVTQLAQAKEIAEISGHVQELVHEKHVAPVQVPGLVKLMSKFDKETQDELMGLFRTQKFNVSEDIGKTKNDKPTGTAEPITAERKKELLKLHGIDSIIEDKGDKKAMAKKWGNN